MVAACGSSPRNSVETGKNPARPKAEEERLPDRQVRTDQIEIVQRDDQRQIAWKVRSKNSDVTLRGDGLVSGRLEQVQGEVFSQNKVASRFRARVAEADQAQQRLELRGEVEFKSLEPPLTLRADQVVWHAQTRRLRAQGNVRLSSDVYEMGPFRELWASPDLREVGTPETWKTK
ncbi:MAG TPA: hypothetical protein PLO61_00045 [Fimbriimonadaceae bacterium]|nr:hypothetical protein [Fimbriimonadaceae bacterium]HRJ33527.1 hypothetical protein [Fimbriimonadaceae bacterium]